MIKAINLAQNSVDFKSKQPDKKDKANDKSKLLPNNIGTKVKQSTQKTMSAFVDYPVKGLQGDVNSNFYEFLTMGIVPYLAGSAMFMIVFNALNLGKFLGAKDAKAASKLGKKMAMGVVLYGAMKTFTKPLVTAPVKLATGVDTELPYQNKVSNLPKGTGKDAKVEVVWQQRKVYDSKEFFRKDLLKRDYYDNVAKKLGLGENLNDSISESTPIIQNIVATTNLAKIISSYCWAAVGVGLAMQDCWSDFFDKISNSKYSHSAKDGALTRFAKNCWNIPKDFCKTFVKSGKELWMGKTDTKGFMKHSGKALVGFAALTTTVLTANAILRAKNMAKNKNLQTIDKTKESTVI